MTKIVDMTGVAEGDTSSLDTSGIASSEKPFDIESIKKFILRGSPIISFKTFKCVILWILYDLVYPKKLGKFL